MKTKEFAIEEELLSKLLEFPGHDFWEVVNKCKQQIQNGVESAIVYCFSEFVDWLVKNGVDELRTVYVETFRLNHNTSLWASDYLSNQNLVNQRYLIGQLENTYENYQFERSTRTPDSIPEIIRFSSLLKEWDQFENFLGNYALYPILRILEDIEDSNPYRILLSFIGDMLALEIGRPKAPGHFMKPVHSLVAEAS